LQQWILEAFYSQINDLSGGKRVVQCNKISLMLYASAQITGVDDDGGKCLLLLKANQYMGFKHFIVTGIVELCKRKRKNL